MRIEQNFHMEIERLVLMIIITWNAKAELEVQCMEYRFSIQVRTEKNEYPG